MLLLRLRLLLLRDLRLLGRGLHWREGPLLTASSCKGPGARLSLSKPSAGVFRRHVTFLY